MVGEDNPGVRLAVALTQWHKKEAKVVQPVGCLAGQLLHEETEDNAQVALVACHHYLHWGRHVGVTVTAAKEREKETVRDTQWLKGQRTCPAEPADPGSETHC